MDKYCIDFIWEMCFRFDPDMTYWWHFLIAGGLTLVFSFLFTWIFKDRKIGINAAAIFAIGIYVGIEVGRDMVLTFLDPGDIITAIGGAVGIAYLLNWIKNNGK